jgi:hypothetical protein
MPSSTHNTAFRVDTQPPDMIQIGTKMSPVVVSVDGKMKEYDWVEVHAEDRENTKIKDGVQGYVMYFRQDDSGEERITYTFDNISLHSTEIHHLSFELVLDLRERTQYVMRIRKTNKISVSN